MSIYITDIGETVDDSFPCVKRYKRFFTNETAANKWKADQEFRNPCIDELAKAMGYYKNEKLPAYLFKKLKEYEVGSIGYEVLLATIKRKASDIEWAIHNKDFKSEINKINYVFAILSNSWKDTKKKMKTEKRQAQLIVPESIDVDSIGRSGSKHDISKFIEGSQ